MLIYMHIVKQFQVLLYNSHNLTWVICLHTVCSIWPIDRALSDATTPGQSGLRSNSNEGVLHIIKISKAGGSPLDGLISYWRHSVALKGLTPLQRCSRYIQQPQRTGLLLYQILKYQYKNIWRSSIVLLRGTLCVTVINIENAIENLSSNLERSCLYFT